MDVFVVSEHEAYEGGSVVGLDATLEGAIKVAREHMPGDGWEEMALTSGDANTVRRWRKGGQDIEIERWEVGHR